MQDWYRARMMSWSGRAVIAAVVLAALLVAAVPVAFVAGVILMLTGQVVGGLALFGASVLAAGAAVVIAGLSGVRHLRKMVSELVGQVGYGDQAYGDQGFGDRGYGDRVVQLDRSEYDYR
jgi:hypothetical protein